MTDRLGHLLLVTLEAARLDADLPCSEPSARGAGGGAGGAEKDALDD